MSSLASPQQLMSIYTEALHAALGAHVNGWPEDDGPLNAYEAVRQTLRLAAAGAVCFLESNPDYPELVKMQTLARQTQLPAADAVYHYARLDGRHTYKITGSRGTAHVFQISVWNGSCSNLRDYRMIAKQDGENDAHLAPGRHLNLTLSATRADGDWIELPPGPCEIFVRQYYADWDAETPAMLSLERVGALYPPPPATTAELEQRLRMTADWLRTQSDFFVKSVSAHLAADLTRLPLMSIPEAFQENIYLCGQYRCGAEEAVLLEVKPPDAVFWGFQIVNLQWEAMDYHMRQSSLNMRQAVLDDDGMFRAVIAHKDPGVANWLDASGRTLGLLSGRYYKASGAPEPTLTRMPLRDLSAHLPPRTAKISPAERQRILKSRMASAYRRLCGDQ